MRCLYKEGISSFSDLVYDFLQFLGMGKLTTAGGSVYIERTEIFCGIREASRNRMNYCKL